MADTKTVVIEVEIDAADKKAVSQLAAALSDYEVTSITYKTVKPVYTGPVHRGETQKGGDLAEKTRQALG